MKRRGRDSLSQHRRTPIQEKPEIFTMTQEEYADAVSWDTTDTPSFALNTITQHSEQHSESMFYASDDPEDSNHSFSWRDIERKNKRRRSNLERETPSASDTQTHTHVAPQSHTTTQTNIPLSSITQSTITLSTDHTALLDNAQEACDDDDSTETIPLPHVEREENTVSFGENERETPITAMESVQVSECVVNIQEECALDEDDFAMLEEMERQALAAQQEQQQLQQLQQTSHNPLTQYVDPVTQLPHNTHAHSQCYLPSSSSQHAHTQYPHTQHTGSASSHAQSSLNALFHHDDTHTTHTHIPTYAHTHTETHTHIPTHSTEHGVLCLRLKALSVTDEPSMRRKRVTAIVDSPQRKAKTDRVEPIAEHTNVFVDLCDDWYETHIEADDVFHAIDIGMQQLLHTHTSTTITSPLSIIHTHTSSHIHVVLTDSHGILSLCPDVLISPTKISEACTCTRRSVLSDRIRHFSTSSASAVLGNIRHTFIESLTERVLTILHELGVHTATERDVVSKLPKHEMQLLISSAIANHIEELYCLQLTDEYVFKDLFQVIEPTMKWITIAAKQGSLALIKKYHVHGAYFDLPPNTTDYSLTRIVGIEESIHSPLLGIKGQIDLIAGGDVFGVNTTQSGRETARVALPIEFKTGKWRASTATGHRAQVILYLLLMSVKRLSLSDLASESLKSQYGMLLYIGEREMKVDLIEPQWAEIRALLLSRNTLAKHIYRSTHSCKEDKEDLKTETHPHTHSVSLTETSTHPHITPTQPLLPALLYNSTHECTHCYSASECMLYHGAIEDGAASSSGSPLLFNYILRGISHQHLQYLRHWDRLLDHESRMYEKKSMGMWNTTGREREESGEKCWSQCVLMSMLSTQTHHTNNHTHNNEKNEKKLVSNEQSISLYLVLSRVKNNNDGDSVKKNERETFSIGDRVLVSLEKENGAENARKNPFARALMSINANICSGSVVAVRADCVELRVSQGQRAITSVYAGYQKESIRRAWTFRIDKDENNVNISTMRSNLMELFIEPFNPKMFTDAHRSTSFSLSRTASESSSSLPPAALHSAYHEKSVHSAATRQRVRELVVDLREPRFQTLPGPLQFALARNRPITKALLPPPPHNNSEGQTHGNPSLLLRIHSLSWLKEHLNETDFEIMFHLFSPPLMDKKVYQLALKVLIANTILTEKNSTTGEETVSIQSGAPLLSGCVNHTLTQSVATHPLLHELSVTARDGGEVVLSPSQLVVYPGAHPLVLYKEYLQLNVGQREAVHKVLCSEDYVLLWGLPGTGKTYTLSFLIRLLVARQQTVLLTSYTHNAVDHVMDKLVEGGLTHTHIMRVHSGNNTLSLYENENATPSVALYQQRVLRARVFVATILTVSRHVLFKSYAVHCDVCVVDEAGQITTPVILAGLLHSNKFVLSGDDYQLPPLVLSPYAAENGLSLSLLKQLMTIHTSAVSTLYIQYRMNAAIMSLCNALVYEQRMICGSDAVAERRLSLSVESVPRPLCGPYNAHTQRDDWLYRALSDALSVVFLNTDSLPRSLSHPSLSHTASSSVENVCDALVVKALLLALERLLSVRSHSTHNTHAVHTTHTTQDTEMSALDCAVITPYRAQVSLIQRLLSGTQPSPTTTHTTQDALGSLVTERAQREFEVSTVDKYQGKDRDVVLFCTVKRLREEDEKDGERERERDVVGMLLRDWRRVNVALTRAKQKLIIVGSKAMMQEDSVLKALSDFVTERDWVIDLPAEALHMYDFHSLSNAGAPGDPAPLRHAAKHGINKHKRVCLEYDLSSSTQHTAHTTTPPHTTHTSHTTHTAPPHIPHTTLPHTPHAAPTQHTTTPTPHAAAGSTERDSKIPAYGSRMVSGQRAAPPRPLSSSSSSSFAPLRPASCLPSFTQQSQNVRRIPLSLSQQQQQQGQGQGQGQAPVVSTAQRATHPAYGQQMQPGMGRRPSH